MAELIAEGMMGENHDFTWKFTNDGTLTILGSGVLKYSEWPSEWDDELANKDKFQKVVFEEGITEIYGDISAYEYLKPHVLELPSTLYYIEGRIAAAPIVLFYHSSIPPKGADAIDAKIVYVPFDAVETYKALNKWNVVMAMPPMFDNVSSVRVYDTNFLFVYNSKSVRISVFTEDGSLVLNTSMDMRSKHQLIKKAGDYIVVADGKQQKLKILADYVEPEKKD